MKVEATVLGSTAAVIGQAFDFGVEFMSGRIVTLELDLYDLDAATLPVVVAWVQNFGTGGSPSSTVTTRLGTLYLNGNEKRHSLTFVVPQLSSSHTKGSNGDDYAALVFQMPFEDTLADLRFSRVRMCEGLSAQGLGSDNDDLVMNEFIPFRAADANTVLVGGYFISTTEFRGALQYPPGSRVPTLETAGTFQIISNTKTSTGVTPTLARAGYSSGEIRVTGLSGHTAGESALLRANSDTTAAMYLNRRIVK